MNLKQSIIDFLSPKKATNLSEVVRKKSFLLNTESYNASSILNDYDPTINDRQLYRGLRHQIPLIDKAIRRICSLTGGITIYANDRSIREELENFIANVPILSFEDDVPSSVCGLNEYIYQFSDMAFEQGFVLGEMVIDNTNKTIKGLKVNDSIMFEWTGGQQNGLSQPRRLYSTNLGAKKEIKRNENQQIFGFDIRGGRYYSILWNLDIVTKIILRMWQSDELLWWRYGDPSMLITYRGSKDETDESITNSTNNLKTGFESVFDNRREGNACDIYKGLPADSTVDIKIIGESAGQRITMNMSEDYRMFAEQVSVCFDLPGWMLNQHWSTTERLSSNQLQIVVSDIWTRQTKLSPIIDQILRRFIFLKGWNIRYGYDWTYEFDTGTIADMLSDAQVRELNSRAEKQEIDNIEKLIALKFITNIQAQEMLADKNIINLLKVEDENKKLLSDSIKSNKYLKHFRRKTI